MKVRVELIKTTPYIEITGATAFCQPRKHAIKITPLLKQGYEVYGLPFVVWVLNHEYFHYILFYEVGPDASVKLDNMPWVDGSEFLPMWSNRGNSKLNYVR